MNREELKRILPHREPMLLLDEARLEDGTALGSYHVTGEEFFLQGHFPGNPVVPGVILCEMLAQNCCVLLGEGAAEGVTPYYTSLDGVRFKQPVHPGDTVELRCCIVREKGPFRFAQGTAHVNGKLCVKAEFSFALVPANAEATGAEPAVPESANAEPASSEPAATSDARG